MAEPPQVIPPFANLLNIHEIEDRAAESAEYWRVCSRGDDGLACAELVAADVPRHHWRKIIKKLRSRLLQTQAGRKEYRVCGCVTYWRSPKRSRRHCLADALAHAFVGPMRLQVRGSVDFQSSARLKFQRNGPQFNRAFRSRQGIIDLPSLP